jgi:hypothetical protein
MTIITDKKFSSNIVSIKKSGAKLDSLIHETGVYIVYQVNTHGRIDLFNKFVGVLNKSARKEALITWLKDHCKVSQKKDKTWEYKHDRKLWKAPGVEMSIDEAIQRASDNPFWEYTKEVAPVSPTLYIDTRMQSLIDALNDETKHIEMTKGKPLTRQQRMDLIVQLKKIAGIDDVTALPAATV